MSVSARVRAPVSYREWLCVVKGLFLSKLEFDYASCHYAWQEAFNSGLTAEQAVQDCKRWLYG